MMQQFMAIFRLKVTVAQIRFFSPPNVTQATFIYGPKSHMYQTFC